MPQELGLLIVFLFVFLFDTFLPKRYQSSLPVLTSVLFGIFTLCNYFMLSRGVAFYGMFENTAATFMIKVSFPALCHRSRNGFVATCRTCCIPQETLRVA